MTKSTNSLLTLLAIVMIVLGSQNIAAQDKEDYPSFPEKLSTAEFEAIDGKKFRLTDYKGKVVLVHLWASWAGPYFTLVPHLTELKSEYSEFDLEIIGLNVGDHEVVPEKRSVMEKFAKRHKINFLLGGISENQLKTFYELTKFNGIPQAILLDRNGRIRGTFFGAGSEVITKLELTVDTIIPEP